VIEQKEEEVSLLKRSLTAGALALAMLPSVASADPVTVGTFATTNGGTMTLAPPGGSGGALVGGIVTLPAAGASVLLSISGLAANTDYLMELLVFGASSTWNTLRAEVLDPLDTDDGQDVGPQPAYVPAGYSTSHDMDGFSFAQRSGLERSASYLGGSAVVTAFEDTDKEDALMFTGVAGASDALRLTFGLRDYEGNRSFLVRLSAADAMSQTPEPASMLLIGTGLAGLAALRRRRAGAAAQA
jgi:hypothetical protein